jgi:anti-sigma factor RsiW
VEQRANDVVHWQTRLVTHHADFAVQRLRRVDVTCEQLTTFIADYIAGKLDTETTLAFEQHLQGCSDCLPFLNTYRKTIDAVRSLREADIPPELQDRVRRFLQQGRKDQGSTPIWCLIWRWIKGDGLRMASPPSSPE